MSATLRSSAVGLASLNARSNGAPPLPTVDGAHSTLQDQLKEKDINISTEVFTFIDSIQGDRSIFQQVIKDNFELEAKPYAKPVDVNLQCIAYNKALANKDEKELAYVLLEKHGMPAFRNKAKWKYQLVLYALAAARKMQLKDFLEALYENNTNSLLPAGAPASSAVTTDIAGSLVLSEQDLRAREELLKNKEEEFLRRSKSFQDAHGGAGTIPKKSVTADEILQFQHKR